MKPLNNYMSKKILIVGASGLVGGEILENLKTTKNELILLSRKKLLCENNVNQIVVDFEDIDSLDTNLNIDEIYIAIGHKLSLSELVYIKKNNRKSFVNVDYNYIKKVAEFAKNCGASSIGLISAIGANTKSFNTYLKVKGDVEQEIKLIGYKNSSNLGFLIGKTLGPIVRPKSSIIKNLKIAKGVIINVTSIASDNVHQFAGPAYATSKAALQSLTREMASDLANEGIRVNAIAPGELETSMVTPKSKKMLTKNIPMKRFGTPEEVAGVIHSMCSDTFSYVNGTEIQINGGQTV